jgi:uroporphyrinogen-III synthase
MKKILIPLRKVPRPTPPPAESLRAKVSANAEAFYDWIVFTSPNGVDAFFKAFFEIYHDARDLGGARIAAIGPATSARVRSYRVQVDVQPDKYVAEEIIRALQQQTSVENLKFLLARAEGAREALSQQDQRADTGLRGLLVLDEHQHPPGLELCSHHCSYPQLLMLFNLRRESR